LQIVWCGEGLQDALGAPGERQRYVDRFSNQFVVLQSVFAVDTQARWYAAARTWGQSSTGPVQDAIAEAIRAAGYSHREMAVLDAAADRPREPGASSEDIKPGDTLNSALLPRPAGPHAKQ